MEKSDDIIGMDDMMAIYEVTDRFGIDREKISVPLEKAGMGDVRRQPDGGLEIVAPLAIATRQWLPTLQAELERLGLEIEDS
jgi:hypothetical protein